MIEPGLDVRTLPLRRLRTNMLKSNPRPAFFMQVLRSSSALGLLLSGALLLSAQAATAAPQLDLPAKRKSPPAKKAGGEVRKEVKRPKGNVAGSRVRDEAKVEIIYGPDGKPMAGVRTVRKNVPGSSEPGGSLDLPAGGAAPEENVGGAEEDTVPAGHPGNPRGSDADGATAPKPARPDLEAWEIVEPAQAEQDPFDPLAQIESARSSARFLFERLGKIRKPSDSEVVEITDRLARLGPDGLGVARYCLGQESPVLAFAGARVLLMAGEAADADEVVRLLRGSPPARSAALIFDELLTRDPVRGNKAFLSEMLQHKNGTLRRAAKAKLMERLTVADIDLLLSALEHRSTEVRKAATEVVAGLEDSKVGTACLLDRVTDRSSSVAAIAIEALARAEAGEADFELLRRLFESPEILRPEAFLVMAIVEREDRRAEPIFRLTHVDALLEGLQSPLPVVSAASAMALAGLGFRSEAEDTAPWLDGPVPSNLVAVASGAVFFDGYNVAREPALRRLRLISGVNHGSNGPEWARWWKESRDHFRADRAVIAFGPGDETRLVVRVDTGLALERPFVLAGAEVTDEGLDAGVQAKDPGRSSAASETKGASNQTLDVLYLTAADARDLAALLGEEGIFSASRLPGPRGTFGLGGRTIEVEVGRRTKTFRFSALQTQPWFDRIMTRAVGLAERNAWQRFPVNGVHGSSRDLFLSEVEWWSLPHEPAERDERFAELLVQHLLAEPLMTRGPAIAELAELVGSGDTGVQAVALQPDQSAALLALLREEAVFGQRARQLTEVIAAAGASQSDADASRAMRDSLVDVLHDHFGPPALDSVARVLQRNGRQAVLEATVDSRSLLRVAAALNLGQGEDVGDIDLALGLLDDEDTDVQVAAIAALAERDAQRAFRPLTKLAQGADNVSTRAAALRAVGLLKGPGALDLLVIALTDTDDRLHLPAAEGLASLEAPEAAPLLVSLLRSNSAPTVQVAAREGLLKLGEPAHDELFSAMRSPDKKLARDAAILLARQLVPRAVPVLASTVALDPDDEQAMEELIILTCVDYSDEALPSESYFRWWDEVNHGDSMPWFLSALEQRGLRAPLPTAFEGQGTAEGRLFLLTVLREMGGHMEARALRELERLHGAPLGPVPLRTEARDRWFLGTRAMLLPGEAVEQGRDDGSGAR